MSDQNKTKTKTQQKDLLSQLKQDNETNKLNKVTIKY